MKHESSEGVATVVEILENVARRLKYALDENVELETSRNYRTFFSYVEVLDSLRNSIGEIQEEIENAVRQYNMMYEEDDPTVDHRIYADISEQ